MVSDQDRVPVTTVPRSKVKGHAAYQEYHLRFVPTKGPRWGDVPSLVLQIGDLTLTLDGLDRTLSGVELYAQPSTWRMCSLTWPTTFERVAAQFEQPKASGFLSYDGDPVVEVDVAQHLARICITGSATRWLDCGDDLVVGLTAEEALADIWLRNVTGLSSAR